MDEAHLERHDDPPGEVAVGMEEEADRELHWLPVVQIGRVRRRQIDDHRAIVGRKGETGPLR